MHNKQIATEEHKLCTYVKGLPFNLLINSMISKYIVIAANTKVIAQK